MISENIPFTDFDALVSTKELNIIKASIPYMTISSQKFISLFVKVRELINTYDLINDDNTLKGCSVESKTDIFELINDIKIYLDKSEVEMIDNYMNAMNTITMYNEYMSVFSNNENKGDKNEWSMVKEWRIK